MKEAIEVHLAPCVDVGCDLTDDTSPASNIQITPPLMTLLLLTMGNLVLVRSPNQVGKTYSCVVLFLSIVLTRPGTYRIVAPTNSQMRGVVGKYINALFRDVIPERFTYSEARGWNVADLELINGSVLQLRSNEQDVRAHAGNQLHGILIDEPPNPDILQENINRTSTTGGFVWLAMTPVGDQTHIREMVYAEGSPWCEIYMDFSRANCFHYTDEAYRRIIAVRQADAASYDQRGKGAWESTPQDRVFTKYGPAVQFDGLWTEQVLSDLRDAGLPPNTPLRFKLLIDHGQTKGHQAVLLMAYLRPPRPGLPPRAWVIAEWTSKTSTTAADDAHAIADMLIDLDLEPGEIDLAVGDTNDAGKGTHARKANDLLAAELAKVWYPDDADGGIPFEIVDARKSIAQQEGVIWTNYMFGEELLKIDTANCSELARCVRQWRNSGRKADGRYKHLIDCLLYGVADTVEEFPSFKRILAY